MHVFWLILKADKPSQALICRSDVHAYLGMGWEEKKMLWLKESLLICLTLYV